MIKTTTKVCNCAFGFLLLVLTYPLAAQSTDDSDVAAKSSQANQPSKASQAASTSAKTTLQSRLASLASYSADFTQQVFDMSGELLQDAKGKIKLQQPQKLYWELLPPNEGVLIADGDTLWHIDPFVEQVVALNQSKAVSNHPIMLIAQPKSALWNGYSVNQKGQQFIVSPLNPQGSIKQLAISFNERSQLVSLELTDQQDQRNVLAFSNILQNPVIDSATFQFTMPQGFDLDDQR